MDSNTLDSTADCRYFPDGAHGHDFFSVGADQKVAVVVDIDAFDIVEVVVVAGVFLGTELRQSGIVQGLNGFVVLCLITAYQYT